MIDAPRLARDFTIRRIIVAADASEHGRAALEAAAMLGERLHAEVEGVFVEDIDLVHLAELPVGREFHLISGQARAFDRELLEIQFGAEAAEARRALRTLTDRAQVRSTFRVVRGRVDAEVIAAASEGDLLVLGTFSRSIGIPRRPGSTAVAAAERAPRSVLLLRRGAKIAGRPIAVHDGSDGADVALEAAVRLATSAREALTVLLVAETACCARATRSRRDRAPRHAATSDPACRGGRSPRLAASCANTAPAGGQLRLARPPSGAGPATHDALGVRPPPGGESSGPVHLGDRPAAHVRLAGAKAKAGDLTRAEQSRWRSGVGPFSPRDVLASPS